MILALLAALTATPATWVYATGSAVACGNVAEAWPGGEGTGTCK